MNFVFKTEFIQGILISFIAALLATFFIFIVKLLKKLSTNAFSIFRQSRLFETCLESYRKTIDDQISLISHPWMKEEQTLSDILIPINFVLMGKTEKKALEDYISDAFRDKHTPRIIILGNPGSGKSISLRVIAKKIWSLPIDKKIIPIFLTFSDIKGVETSEELEKRIVIKLKYYHFDSAIKDDEIVEKFVKEYLYNGNILLLIDGYDEVEKSFRFSSGKFLCTFLGTHKQIPIIISSRMAVYENELVFKELKPDKINIAPFTPFSILKFVSQWEFKGSKSSHKLFEMITQKTHLLELASNPLMLTIITFLYSLPKYTLPENRVEFYEQCTRALLEEWDRSQNRDRVNRFESHQKIAVLSRIAYDHISTAEKADELINESKIHEIIKSEMQLLSLKANEYVIMRDEIVVNSGLLQQISPTEYRFPHRSFLEFFAAWYLDNQKACHSLINLFENDPIKWQETLLLYMGLNKNKEFSNLILNYLFQKNINFKEDEKGKFFALILKVLAECAIPDPKITYDVLEQVSSFFSSGKFQSILVEELGLIAANPRWSHSQRAKEILLNLINRKLNHIDFHQVIIALLQTNDKEVEKNILKNFAQVNLSLIAQLPGLQTKTFLNDFLNLELSIQQKQNVIDNLRENSNFNVLGALLIEHNDQYIKELAAYSLFRMSNLAGFLEFLDSVSIELLSKDILQQIDKIMLKWGWRFDYPKTESGKKFVFLINIYVCQWLKKNFENFDKKNLEEADTHFRYLISCLLMEDGFEFHRFNLLSAGTQNVPHTGS